MPVLTIEQQNEVIGGGAVFYLDSSGRWWGTGFTPGDDDCIDINGNLFKATGGLNLKVSASGLEITGSSVGQDLELFLKNNTNSEWALSINKNEPNSNGTLNTSYSENSAIHDINPNYNTYVHTHPYGSKPSDDDLDAKKKLQDAGYEYFYIHYGHEYFSY